MSKFRQLRAAIAALEDIRHYSGDRYAHKRASEALKAIESCQADSDPYESLTERELEILVLIADGMSDREIAEELVVEDATVRTHVHNILNKLELANRTQAAMYAVRVGLVIITEGD